MNTTRKNAKRMARYIFKQFDEGEDKCQRFSACGGKWPDNETNLGGMCESAFADMIERAIVLVNDK